MKFWQRVMSKLRRDPRVVVVVVVPDEEPIETFVDDKGQMTHRIPGMNGLFPGRMSLEDELAAEAEIDKERGQ